MEIKDSIEVGRTNDGLPLYRHRFINSVTVDYMAKAHSYFTKEEKKLAKLNHKANIKNN
jgi:hypothetical protein